MSRCGLISSDLKHVLSLTCPSCAYGKAHRLPWCRNGIRNLKKIRQATAPGQVVSVDQIVSPTLGFVPIHCGLPTKQRYIGVTVFIDHFSDFTYIHLMTVMNVKSTIEAKEAYDRLALSHSVTNLHYHADNGLFDTAVFKTSIKHTN